MSAEPFTLTIDGTVDRPLRLSYDDLLALPSLEREVCIECDSGARENSVMKGVSIARLLALAGAGGHSSRAVIYCADGYNESIPLVELLHREAFLAYAVDGERLAGPGWPVRLAVPGKHGHKWAKWVRRIELVADAP